MSTRDHTLIEELMAAGALGGLDPADQAALDRELADHEPCDGCRELEVAFGRIAGGLALSLDPVPVDAGMADRILAKSGRVAFIPDLTAASLPELPESPEPLVAAQPDPLRYKDKRNRNRRWAVAVSVAAVIGLIVVASLAYLPGLGRVSAHPVAAQRFIQLTPTAGGGAQLSVGYTPGKDGVIVWGSNLPDPGEGKVYELWMIQGTTPVSGGCLQPVDGQVAVFIDANLDGTDSMALTAEPSACPSAPTSGAVMSGTLAII
jgi:Anti-sigma-K factor rskA